MPPKEKVEFNDTVPAQKAAQYLESLARGLRDGTVLLESGDSSLTIDIPDDVKIQIEGSSDAEKGKASIELTLSMRRREAQAPVAPGLLIVPGGAAAEPVGFAD